MRFSSEEEMGVHLKQLHPKECGTSVLNEEEITVHVYSDEDHGQTDRIITVKQRNTFSINIQMSEDHNYNMHIDTRMQ